MLTHRLSGVETASTPDRRSRYTSRIAAPTSDCSFPRTTRLPRVSNGHGRGMCSTIPCRRSPAESPRGETCRSQSGPDGHCLHMGAVKAPLCHRCSRLIVLSEVQGRRAQRPCEPCRSGAGVAAARITASNTSPRTPKEKRMQRLALTLLTLLLLPLPGWSTNLSLFVIQRNKNTNEVQYELRVNDRCSIVTAYPVAAVWRLREVSPEQTEALSGMED